MAGMADMEVMIMLKMEMEGLLLMDMEQVVVVGERLYLVLGLIIVMREVMEEMEVHLLGQEEQEEWGL